MGTSRYKSSGEVAYSENNLWMKNFSDCGIFADDRNVGKSKLSGKDFAGGE